LREDAEDILIRECIEWDRTAQNKLYQMYCARMFAVCLRYSRNREEAEDTLHEGFMTVFEKIKNFEGSGSLEGWIRRIMVNTAIQKYRKNSRLFVVVSLEEMHADSSRYYTDDILDQIGAKEIILSIQKLPPKYRMVFNLYVFEQLKHREISKLLGISVGTSKSNLSDARSILQKILIHSRPAIEQA